MKSRLIGSGVCGLAVVAAAACSGSGVVERPDASVAQSTAALGVDRAELRSDSPSPPRAAIPTAPNYVAGPADFSPSIVQRGARIDVAYATESRPLRDLPDAVPFERDFEHAPGRNPLSFEPAIEPDHVVQSGLPIVTMPVTLQSFLGQGSTLGNCVFPKPDAGEPAGCTTTGDPPDTVGAVGPNHYVQLVNSGIAIWNKSGAALTKTKYTSSLFAGMSTADGNHCASPPYPDPPGGDWGDGVVLYDQMADRWVVTQFDLTNFVNNNTTPSYQCVAVSKTGDPTGAYYLYDFQYNVQVNDYGKFSVWPDAYYASYNDFNPNFTSSDVCAWDRVSMLAGKPATQQCFTNATFGLLPASVDGAIKPPNGEPGFFVSLRSGTSIGLYKFHVDWTTPANSTFTGPTSLAVSSYSQLCGGGSCIAQPSGGNPLASLGDRPMFHLGYRNFGTLESLVFNHSVAAGGAGGVRWYEIRSPNGTPVVFQQGTYAPADGNYRWMGSIAQDQAQDMALGFSISGASTFPSVAWTGRSATDAAGTMGQAEAVIQQGAGVEEGTFSDGSQADRWGDYSNMAVDPSDDCTFWYTQELFSKSGTFNWDTHVSSVTFPNCAVNDFTIGLTPASASLPEGGKVTYTVTTSSAKGTAETIALTAQDLPGGVTAAFVPASVAAGASSTLTLTAPLTAPLTATADTFTVIGKATSAVHAATAKVSVVPCAKLTACPAPDNCGTIPDGCGGTLTCGTACAALDACHLAGTCTANVCSNPVAPAGKACNDGNACTTADACTSGGTCAGAPVVCTNGDACHNAGTCQASSGTCSAPTPKASGTACDDSNACTSGDACTSTGTCAGSPVVCTNGDACHDPGTCQIDGGTCSAATPKSNGTTCTGTDACIQAYTCQSGTCTAGAPVVCVAQDECHDVGTCAGATGACSNPPKTDGTACSIGTCVGGVCTAADAGSTPDAGTGMMADAGDAGGRLDASVMGDGAVAPIDAAAPQDAAAASEGGSVGEGGVGGGAGQSGGCGCRVAQPKSDSPVRVAGLGLLVGVALLRRRRAERSAERGVSR